MGLAEEPSIVSFRFTVRRRLSRVLRPVLPLLQRLRYGTANPIRPWSAEPGFDALMRPIEGHSLVDRQRCHLLHQFLKQALALPGQIAEVGVYRGGTARLMATVAADSGKTVHLFDTFEGMPETDAGRDWHKAADFADTSLDMVRTFLQGLPVEFHPGVFPRTAEGLEDARFCFVHVDADIYESVKSCCEFFYPRMPAGGILLFDDYGFVTCKGAKQAVDEFFERQAEVPIYLPTGQCVVHRLGP